MLANRVMMCSGIMPDMEPEFILTGMVATQELTTSVVALTTTTANDSLSGLVATLGVATLVE